MKLIINNRDRLHTLQEMVAWAIAGGHQVVIVDQASTYQPLLDWYGNAGISVIHSRNVGPWPDIRSGMLDFGRTGQLIAYSDSDLDLSECPRDMLERFAEILGSNSSIRKVGCALRIDDLPNTPVANHAWKRELEFWPGGFAQPNYPAKIASTLAVYRVGQNCRITTDLYGPAIRVAGDCTARHRPWYYTADNLPDDERYYLDHLERKGPVFSGILRKELSTTRERVVA